MSDGRESPFHVPHQSQRRITMSTPINNLSSESLYQADGVNPYQQRRQNFEALAQALQSNDLTAAKQAYTALAQSIPSGADQPNNPFAQIGQALQSNDLA